MSILIRRSRTSTYPCHWDTTLQDLYCGVHGFLYALKGTNCRYRLKKINHFKPRKSLLSITNTSMMTEIPNKEQLRSTTSTFVNYFYLQLQESHAALVWPLWWFPVFLQILQRGLSSCIQLMFFWNVWSINSNTGYLHLVLLHCNKDTFTCVLKYSHDA